MERDPIVDNGHNRRKAERVQSVISGLIAQQTFYVRPYQPSPVIIADTREGFDIDGNFHTSTLRETTPSNLGQLALEAPENPKIP